MMTMNGALDLMTTAKEARTLSNTQKMVNQAIKNADKAVEEAARMGKKNTYFYMNNNGDVNYRALVEVVVSLYKLGYGVKVLLLINPEIKLCWEDEAIDMPIIVNEELSEEKTMLIAEMVDEAIKQLD
ncbi:hypothetical protein [Limosilactobacillus reuteri]|uniref:hypothetical protein n=1 Tax=Limosilactobacillus reuteri TaxID=1598 RepID=UPI001E434CF1|nr:hypothetical protein [Limosilactobacillus reuteri]MCC4459627.1 hypothetical protein [Limosilactobacillus reuteri]MCC4463496.1 hypothetical protein [Limosilactobacillus reuteri]